jgi:hypothetical protein
VRELLGLVEIDADVRQGSLRDAILCAVGTNAEHGLRRTNRDKRNAVDAELQDCFPSIHSWLMVGI